MEDNIVFKQLSDCIPVSHNNLISVSKLIYETDKFIYPCLFNGSEDALKVLPEVIHGNEDAMFRLDNFYVAEVKHEIIGLILWHKGPLVWDSRTLSKHSLSLGVPISRDLSLVQTRYFETYKTAPENTISVINVCIHPLFRNRGICKRFLKSFIDEHAGEKMELYVLDSNCSAKKVYFSTGFKVAQMCQGFSADNRNLPCLRMELN